jgi:hypothetical protein
MFLHGIFSLVMLVALARIDTSCLLDSNAQVISPSSNPKAWAGKELYPGVTLETGGYALTLLATFECARFTLRSDTQVRPATPRYYPAGAADQIPIPLSLVKDALRSVTGYIGSTAGGAARAGYYIPTSIILIGIRG